MYPPVNGVGTAMMKTSAGLTVVDAEIRPLATSSEIASGNPGSSIGDWPELTTCTTRRLMSTPMTRMPARATTTAVGRPI